MDKINVGNIILRLRKEKNITQEQLANMVGISAGAVSKWETGCSTPDISLLAPIARALNTSIDTLLGFKLELPDDGVRKIKEELTNIFLHKGYEKGEEVSKEYIEEYPNSIYLKLVIAGLIQMYSMMADDNTEEKMNLRMEYCLKLFYEVAESDSSKYVPSALFSIANIEMMLKRYEKSEEALKELSNSFIDPMVLYTSLYRQQGKNDEAKKLCKSMLLHYLNQGMAMISILASIYKEEKNYNKSALYLESLNNIEENFKVGMNCSAYNYCKLNIEMNKKDVAGKWFKKYIDGCILAPYNYDNNPYFEGLKLEVDEDGQKVIRKKLLESIIQQEEFKVLSGCNDYEESILKLKNAIHDM